MHFLKSLAKKTIYKILICLRTLIRPADFDFVFFLFTSFSTRTRTLTSLFTAGFRKSDLPSLTSHTILGPISRFYELTTDFSRFLEK